jgi:hypothetical protein
MVKAYHFPHHLLYQCMVGILALHVKILLPNTLAYSCQSIKDTEKRLFSYKGNCHVEAISETEEEAITSFHFSNFI